MKRVPLLYPLPAAFCLWPTGGSFFRPVLGLGWSVAVCDPMAYAMG